MLLNHRPGHMDLQWRLHKPLFWGDSKKSLVNRPPKNMSLVSVWEARPSLVPAWISTCVHTHRLHHLLAAQVTFLCVWFVLFVCFMFCLIFVFVFCVLCFRFCSFLLTSSVHHLLLLAIQVTCVRLQFCFRIKCCLCSANPIPMINSMS